VLVLAAVIGPTARVASAVGRGALKFIPKISGSCRAELAPSYYSIFDIYYSIFGGHYSIFRGHYSIFTPRLFHYSILLFHFRGYYSIFPAIALPLFHFHYSIFACKWNNAAIGLKPEWQNSPGNKACFEDFALRVRTSIIPFCAEMD
jgi:hypothetical protein